MDYDRIMLELLNRIGILEEKVSVLEGKQDIPEPNQTDFSQGVSKKYRFLADYLHGNNEETIKLHFEELERILGFKLPNSAYTHRAYWANTTTHSVALSWLNVGYKTVEVDLDNKFIVFEKNRSY